MVSSVNLKELSKGNFGPRLYVIEFRLRVTALLRKITDKYIRIVLMDLYIKLQCTGVSWMGM